jgi:hypothetical protein
MPTIFQGGAIVGDAPQEGRESMTILASTGLFASIGAIVYIALLLTLGIISIRKGHWVMFLVGLFIPLFWLIGALLPRKVR